MRMIYNMNFLRFLNYAAESLTNCKGRISCSREKRCGHSTTMQKEKYIHNTASLEVKTKKTNHKTLKNISMHYDNETSFLKSM